MSNDLPQWMVKGRKRAGTYKPIISRPEVYFEKRDISYHMVELWKVLRKIFKNVFILIVVVFLLPGYDNGLLLDPFVPLVLQIFNFIINHIFLSLEGIGGVEIFIGSPLTPVTMYINLTIFIAFVLSLPMTVRELVAYIRPGMKDKEMAVLKDILGKALMLFLLGVFISFKFIIPNTLRILVRSGGFIGESNLLQIYSLSSVINLLLWGTLGGGLLYASPLVLVVLVNIEVLTADQLSNRRREIMMVIFIIAAFITPDPTIISMLILSLPMIVVTEFIIIWSYRIELNAFVAGDRSVW